MGRACQDLVESYVRQAVPARLAERSVADCDREAAVLCPGGHHSMDGLKIFWGCADNRNVGTLRSKIRAARRDERGFTLPELLAAIVIMAILASVALSTWNGVIESRRVDSATNQLAGDLRLAHGKATNQLSDISIIYRTDAKLGGSSACAGADYCMVKGTTYTPRNLPVGAKITDSSVLVDLVPLLGTDTRTLTFKSDGSVVPVGGLPPTITQPTITVSSTDDNPSHIVEIIKATSRVQIDP
jgi:type IV fimbrial biogenesis protein FimT